MRGHAIVNDDVMSFAIAVQLSTVGSIRIGFLIFEKARKEPSLGFPGAKEIENCSEVREFNVELNKASDICFFTFGVYSTTIVLEVEKY